MKISRIVISNFRALKELDIQVRDDLTCIIGENSTGKTAILRAIQMCLDVSLPSSFRSLIREDINATIDVSHPSQVLVGIEFTSFQGVVNEEALVATWKIAADRARIFYRFRPRPSVREQLDSGIIEPGTLTLEEYAWEIKGGGDPAIDLPEIKWNDDVGENVRFSDLQSYLIVSLPALRDVEADFRNNRTSPLVKLIEAYEVGQVEQDELIEILNHANTQIENSATISKIANDIDATFKSVSGPAFEMDAKLGLSAATFQAIARNLKLLLSDLALDSFEPSRNGLGMNNILYVAILLEYLDRRKSKGASAGHLILFEEPEAHLHPQLQASLLIALRAKGIQTILTSHSTHITSQVPFTTLVSLTRRDDASISSCNLASNDLLGSNDYADLERFLDSTKSSLLFARKVMLVEGPAELFLIPAMIEAIHGIRLEREGISVIAIYGVHFGIYAALFRNGQLEKRCAIVADADLKPSDATDEFDPTLGAPDLAKLRGDWVEVFAGATTFERELVMQETLPMLIATTIELGAPMITKQLEEGLIILNEGKTDATARAKILQDLGATVLKTAKRFGKARFSQIAARHASKATRLPTYIQSALDWLRA
jgi:putative ATP-dependent endonuclease of the OLD family